MSERLITLQALTLWQPWASLLIGGYKRFETRSWRPFYKTRFWCAVHAAKNSPKPAMKMLDRHSQHFLPAAAECLQEMGYDDFVELPCGAILGVVLWETIRPTVELEEQASELDLLFGDWTAGRFAWKVARAQRFNVPIPARGSQGLWQWELPSSMHEWWLEYDHSIG